MNIGSIIKMNRLKQNLKQEDLAEGIISTSYLSKIENGKIEPNDEVIKLLCMRLDIEINRQIDEETRELCYNWFHILLTSFKPSILKQEYQRMSELTNTIPDLELQILLKIHVIRYFLKIGETNSSLEQINQLKEISTTFSGKQKYYWFKFNGNYHSITEEDSKALQFYTMAEDLIAKNDLPDEEIADLQYVLGVTYSKLRLTSEAQSYANKALDFYRQIYNFSRCAECHLILGISYRRIQNYDKAIKNYQLAKQLAEHDDTTEIIQLTHLNLGYLYYAQGKTDQAIKYLDMIVEEKESSLENRLLALTAIVEEYYKANNYEEAKRRIEEGLGLITEENKERYLLFYYEIYTYRHLTERNLEKFEEMMVHEFIPYLEEQKDYARLTNYATLLANYYEDLHKYKTATKYYKLVNFSYKQINQI
ncbi:helix-turn-helix domain-containing protein [Heyndrickxia acidicola]|uniref:Helix-turn-helix transcriptional regulator n=1 Tax=Heyndrickxia acidicola TaxID=209389 RepID=A0ABU6MDA1_9BACI|nr:helix-turn-helix domain-containing protein [Heyndrickxia acidicola]MED1202646.1 helix-turn-helix transcriptional regulator [Heyndrickxia acidicola]